MQGGHHGAQKFSTTTFTSAKSSAGGRCGPITHSEVRGALAYLRRMGNRDRSPRRQLKIRLKTMVFKSLREGTGLIPDNAGIQHRRVTRAQTIERVSGEIEASRIEMILSVPAPARNEEDCIAECLQSLIAQSEDGFRLGRIGSLTFSADDGSTHKDVRRSQSALLILRSSSGAPPRAGTGHKAM